MSMIATASLAHRVAGDLPKSYLLTEEKEELLRTGRQNLVYLCESQRAGMAGDEDAAWAWLALAKLPAETLLMLKMNMGAQFVRENGFDTELADAAYGEGWLDREEKLCRGK